MSEERLTKNQTEILNLFRKDVFLSKTIRGIAFLLKKSYSKIYEAIKEMGENKIIKIKDVGRAKVCEIFLNPKTISTFSFLDEQESFSSNIPNIEKIIGFKEFLDDIILITGSYAKKRQTKQSDIDLVIITKEGVFKKQKLIENLTSLFNPRVHAIAISYKDFIKMLLEKEPNYAHEIFKNRLLFRNSHRYYELIKEAIKNGFRG